MFDAIVEFVCARQGDSDEFIEKVRAIAVGVACGYSPVRLYIVRIDNWFGPKWMNFAGKFTAGKGAAIGVHKTILHVPPFVPHRVVEERVFVGPDFEETVAKPALHIACPSEVALGRRIAEIDKDAAFLWFSGESEAQGRGAVMVYLPSAAVRSSTAQRRGEMRHCGAFYAGFSRRETGWEPAMLRGVARGEVSHLEESGRAVIDEPFITVPL
jgi:hypothetical protein